MTARTAARLIRFANEFGADAHLSDDGKAVVVLFGYHNVTTGAEGVEHVRVTTMAQLANELGL